MNKKFVSTFLLMMISVYFIMFFPQVVTRAYEVVFQPEEAFSQHTSIGAVSVDSLSRKEAEAKVLNAAEKWKTSQEYTLTFADQSVQIPINNFSFSVPESVMNAKDGEKNPLYVKVNDRYVTSVLTELVGQDFLGNINQQALKVELEKQAGLFDQKRNLSVTNFMRGEGKNRQVVSSANTVINETNSLEKWMGEYPTFTIPSHAQFSFIQDFVGDQTVFSNDFLSKVSSVLYEASLATNLEIMERSISTELPDGYKLGYEATVNVKDLDFTLYNPNDYDMTVQFRVENQNTLVADINGVMTGKVYKAVEKERKTYPYKQIIQYPQDPNSVQEQPGKEGYSVKVYRDVYDSKGKKLNSTFIAKDFYLPVNEVVVERPVSTTTSSDTMTTDILTPSDTTPTETTIPSDSTTTTPETGQADSNFKNENTTGTSMDEKTQNSTGGK